MKKLIALSLCLAFLLSGCGAKPGGSTSVDNPLNIQPYEKMTDITEVVKTYQQEFDEAKVKGYDNISFEDNVHVAMPQISELNCIKTTMITNVPLEERKELMKECIDKFTADGYKDEYLDQFEIDDGDELMFKNKDTGELLWTVDYSLLNLDKGKIRNIMGRDGYLESEELDSIRYYDGDDVTFKLLDGEMTYKEVQEYATKIFDEELPYQRSENVTTFIPEIRAHKLKDDYVWLKVSVQRAYKNIPLEHFKLPSSTRAMSNGKTYDEDVTNIEMCDANDIDEINFGFGIDKIDPIGPTYTQMVSMKDAMDIVANTLSKSITFKVEDVYLNYIRTIDENDTNFNQVYLVLRPTIGEPAWIFEGKSSLEERQLRVYVNAITGELTYRSTSG